MVKANVDKILDVLKEKPSISLADLSHRVALPKETVQQSLEYMEEEGVVKLEHKLANVYVNLVKAPQPEGQQQAEPAPIPQHYPQPDMRQPLQQSPKQPIQQPQNNEPHPKDPWANPVQPEPLQPEKDSAPKPLEPNTMPQPINPSTPLTQPPVMQSAPVQSFGALTPPTINFNQNPIEPQSPGFNLDVPTPGGMQSPPPVDNTQRFVPGDVSFSQMPQESFSQPVQIPQEQQSDFQIPAYQPKYVFPDYVESEMDKMEYLIDQAHSKITEHDFDGLNTMYRKIYGIYKESQDLSPNERHLISEKIQELFLRIKRIYLIENAT